MSKAKPNNSFIFLTTLGVYIGLLMVGATPGIVAQQGAMTRNFEISEEVEVKDDLDLDPKDELAGSEDRELKELISSSSIRSIVQVYLSQFAVDQTSTGTAYFASTATADPTILADELTQVSFWPNDVRKSPSHQVSSLPRSALLTLHADAK